MVTKTDQELDHKVYLIKFQKAEITQALLANYNLINLESGNSVRVTVPCPATRPPGIHKHSSCNSGLEVEIKKTKTKNYFKCLQSHQGNANWNNEIHLFLIHQIVKGWKIDNVTVKVRPKH